MPVRKFKSPPEHDDSVWMDPRDPDLVKAIIATWETARRLSPPLFTPGVYKHTSIEDANRQTEEWERQSLRRASGRAGR